jgi:serine protease Do
MNSLACFGQNSLKDLVKKNEKSVFLVQCFNKQNQIVSTGSGFFIDKSGIAFTNVHVIKDAYKAKIKTTDGKFYDIEKIIDYNSSLDVAKIKIKNLDGTNFSVTKTATKKSEKGEEIFTIGNPDGLESSVSTGIISAIRTIPDYGECYQITAPISPGSSGGALFNMNGEVIGITTFGQTDENHLNQSLNFAININNAKYINKNLNLGIETVRTKVTFENFVSLYMRFQLSGDYENAIKICTDQLKIKSNDGSAYHWRANTFLSINELTLAENDFNKSLIYSSSINVKEWDYIGLGKIYRRSGQYEKSKESYLKAIEINNENAITYCNLAVLASNWHGPDSELVEPSYMMALKIDPSSCAFGYKSIAQKFVEKKEYEKAISFFTLSIETEQNKSSTINEYYNRGTCYFQLKKYSSAVNDFRNCISMMPNDIQSYLWLGLTYYEQGKKLEACSSFNKAQEINVSVGKDDKTSNQILEYINKYCL